MAKRIENSTRISKEIKVEDWVGEKGLRIKLIHDITQNIHSPLLWEKAYDYFYQRVSSRFLNPIKWIIEKGQSEGEGFSAVALQCILIEFIESFYQGKIYTTSQNPRPFEYNSSVKLFTDFLMNHDPFSHYFKMEKSARGFYENVRCGLLHEASTKETSLIRAKSQNHLLVAFKYDNKNMIVYRNNFLHAINDFLSDYKNKLFEDKQLKINFIRKFDDICGIKRELYFAYGSNLDREQLITRIKKKYHTAGKAILNGYKFTYNKKSEKYGAAANIIECEGSKVHGICYEIDKDDLNELDRHERGYDRTPVKVIYNSTEVTAITYRSKSFTNEQPSKEYKSIILKAANAWRFDEEYINNNLL